MSKPKNKSQPATAATAGAKRHSDQRLVGRWSEKQKERAHCIVNDIAEDIDNHETRAELRQALAIYADMLCDALQNRAYEKTEKMMEVVNKLAELMAANDQAHPTAAGGTGGAQKGL